jgi:DNA-binding winged helix-turn-helix (wHTH) protein/predicted ATPase
MRWRFGRFQLDRESACLWEGEQRLTLRPKTFDLLVYLVAHAGELVRKETLLETIWPHTVVADGVLTTSMGELRKVLGETAKQPQYIATVHRRGYRFIAPVIPVDTMEESAVRGGSLDTSARLPLHAARGSGLPGTVLVDRETELARLHQWFRDACHGQRHVVFVPGEAGIGKTTLVDVFLTQIAPQQPLAIGRGQCIDHYGAGEAYLPLLEAFGQLGQAANGTQVIEVLRQHAPSWLLQLPALWSTHEVPMLQQRALGATRERMLRELAEAVEILAHDRPLVLVLEDLHWSDVSTLDWLAYVARRRAPARLLVLGTYRPIDAVVRQHPIRAVTQELRVHGQCEELRLPYLSEAGVTAYVAERFGEAVVSPALVRAFHQRTNGNPMFLLTVVEEMVRQGRLRGPATGGERLGPHATAVMVDIPESLRHLIDQQLEQLHPDERACLEVASVAGGEFSVAAVAAGTDYQVDEMEARYAALARRGHFVQACGTEAWPDGTITARYGFTHDLYQQVAYQRLGAAQRVRLHRQLARGLETAYGQQASERAAELAWHCEQGRDHARAIAYLQQAAGTAVRRHAHQEAIDSLQRALALLQTLPDTPERLQQALHVHVALGGPLMATKGQAAPEVEQTYSQAYALCQQVEDTAALLPVLAGLRLFYVMQAAHQTAQGLGQRLLTLAERHHDQAFLLEAQVALGGGRFFLGQFDAALVHLQQGMACEDVLAPPTARVVHHPRISCHVFASWALWCLGYPDQALVHGQEALTRAQRLSNPYVLMWCQSLVANLHILRGEAATARQLAEASLALAMTLEVPFWGARSTYMRGLVLIRQGGTAEGLKQMQAGWAAIQTTGVRLNRGYFLARLAEALLHAGQPDSGLTVLAEALAFIHTSGERWWEAECHRLWGQLLLHAECGVRHAALTAEECFQQALDIARRQHAKSLELQAAMSLARLWQQQGKRTEASELLAPVYDWFTEGFDTADLQEAKALLDELER